LRAAFLGPFHRNRDARGLYRGPTKASQLLEPIMRVEVEAMPDHAEAIAADLVLRRGIVLGEEHANGRTTIRAEAPMANLFIYAARIQLFAPGAEASLAFCRYAPVPHEPDDTFPMTATLRA
jgi:translation elongation factor EF-G